jgi:membrane associated rhomboid family serine protease
MSLYNRQMNFVPSGMTWTEVVKFLILTNVTIFAVQELFGLKGFLVYNFALIPAALFSGSLWQIGTYMFLHGGFAHILFNMIALWMFGSALERVWGSKEFLKYYVITGIGGGLCYALFNTGSLVPTVGASGAIYGLLLAFGVLFPDEKIYVWGILPIKAKYFVLIFGGIEFLASFNQGSGVAHLAHLGGMAVGYIYLRKTGKTGGGGGGGGSRFGGNRLKEWERKMREGEKERDDEETERIRREVDELLDKINRVGFDGLSKNEQQRLEEASKFLRDRGL